MRADGSAEVEVGDQQGAAREDDEKADEVEHEAEADHRADPDHAGAVGDRIRRGRDREHEGVARGHRHAQSGRDRVVAARLCDRQKHRDHHAGGRHVAGDLGQVEDQQGATSEQTQR